MMSADHFAHHLELLSDRWPALAVSVPYADCSQYEYCQTERGELNLLKHINAYETVYYHSQESAATEADQWFSSLPLEGVKVLYVFGLGLGYYYEAALNWLKQDAQHYLVFVEDDLAVYHHFLKTDHAETILHDQQVHLTFLPDSFEKGGFLTQEVTYFALLPVSVSALRYYEKNRKAHFELLQQELIASHIVANNLAIQQLKINSTFYKHYYLNISNLPQNGDGNRFIDKFRGIPAIICGAGPSLDKALPLLSQLSERALIFAGGSAVTALTRHGIIPHFCAGLSPNEAERNRFWLQTGYEVPIFYRPRIDPEALKMMHGVHLHTNGGGGNPTARWIETELGIEGPVLEEGSSVSYFCSDLAFHFGCNPIIYVGLDLAHEHDHIYAEGVLDTPEESSTTDPFFMKIEVKDIHGAPVVTMWKWVAESIAMAKYIARRPESTFLNASGAGIGIPGVLNVDFRETIDARLKRRYDLSGRIQVELANSSFDARIRDELPNLLNRLQESLKKCAQFAVEMIAELHHIEAQIVPSILEPIHKRAGIATDSDDTKSTFDELRPWPFSGIMALIEQQLSEEEGYNYLLQPILNGRRCYLQRLYDEFMREGSSSLFYQKQRKIAILTEQYTFLKQCAEENLALLHLKDDIYSG